MYQYFNNSPSKKIFSLEQLSSKTQRHLVKTYSTLLILCALATAGAAVSINYGLTILFSIFSIVFSFMFFCSSSYDFRLLGLGGISFCQGAFLGPLIEYSLSLDKSLPFVAFLSTSIIFGCFSLFALISKRREYLYLGGMISSFGLVLILFSLINIFIRSNLLFSIELYGGLALFCAYVIYDTQVIIERSELGHRDPLTDSYTLFIDAIALFTRILIILSKNKKDDKDKKKRRREEF